ncbi:MAG: right-handed parallel beta-helix repeat-containing protein [Anaerolineae bacterium]
MAPSLAIESTVAIDDNIIDDNVAASAPGAVGRGGGLYIKQSDGTTLTGNQIRGNVASAEMRGTGGGLVVNCSEITLTANLIAGNYANATSTYPGWGGGLFLDKTTPEWRTLTLIGNIISGNVAAARGEGEGGGLYLSLTPVRLFGNRIEGNIASIEMPGRGGGIYLDSPGMGPLQGNVISGNVASMADDGFGGGIYLDFADRLLLAENTIVGNAATQDPGAASQGGGIYMRDSVPITLTNNVVTGNRAYDQGSGLWFDGFPYNPAVRVSMLHTTLADNGGCGQGLYVGDTTILTLTNTIVAGHNDAGIRVSQGSTVTLEATLWFSNGIHLDSAGHVSAGAINIYDDPAFAGGGDYHLTAGSAARDAGVPCGLAIDIDGRLRPIGPAPDLGADEFAYPNYLPLAIKES